MALTIRYFASLREQLQCDHESLDSDRFKTVAELRAYLSEQHGSSGVVLQDMLCAINHEYADDSRLLADGDEVAFFPPVTGG